MASLSRLRFNSIFTRRHFSSILSPDSTTPLTTKQKTRAALTLLKSEKNPYRILDICRAASLTPESHLDRIAFSVAISNLKESKSFDAIRTFLEELKTRPDLRNERFIAHSIVLYGQAQMLDHAIRTFEQMGQLGISPSPKSLNALLFACIVANKYDEEGDLNEAKRLFNEMCKKGCTPESSCYFTLIHYLCQGGDFDTALKVCKDSMAKDWIPNFTTMKALVNGLVSNSKVEEARELVGKMKEKFTINADTWKEIEEGLPQ